MCRHSSLPRFREVRYDRVSALKSSSQPEPQLATTGLRIGQDAPFEAPARPAAVIRLDHAAALAPPAGGRPAHAGGARAGVLFAGRAPRCAADAGPLVPFTDVMVTESRRGRRPVQRAADQDRRRRSADGSRALRGPDRRKELSRLRTLLESEQFRREVAATTPPEPPQCSDQVTLTVVMGPLQMSRTGPCPSRE